MIQNMINKIITGNCLELLKEIPDESVDMTFADPPFNLKKKYTNYHDSLEFKEYLDWCDKWIFEMVRITKPTGSIFVHNIPKWLSYYNKFLNEYANFKHWISWNAPTAPMGKSLQPAHYGILFYVKDIKQAKIYELRMPHERERKSSYLKKDYGGKKAGMHPYGPLVSDVWTDIHRIKHNKYRDEHPCQLPIPLLERLILMSTDENDIVLDPFMGTGTTSIAAKKLGRRYIGFDLNEEYKVICENKLEKVDSDSKIGSSWVSFNLGEVRTIRNKDWDNLSSYFEIPKNRKEIDFIKIKLKG
jgi:site-specific DNA-methyltransferase (adenine-specific)|tara:strand:- start:53 stop:955 length:903 start_codon:yes stop_codon:yes gene_type:complete